MARIGLMLALGLLLSAPALAGAAPRWRTLDGGFQGYYLSNLPPPVAIYVLGSNAVLLGVVPTGGSYQDDQVARVKQAFAAKQFSGVEEHPLDLASLQEKLELYLDDQGVVLSDVLGAGRSRAVLLIDWMPDNPECAWLKSSVQKYKAAILEGLGERARDYSYVELRLSAPGVKISCPEQSG
ncbi:MAG TPA: hypothetical protein VFN09_04225 [Rhodanobacteraceae bacterium]|nr:hypothetical protein [Rhodanobacteraceae bacterium]